MIANSLHNVDRMAGGGTDCRNIGAHDSTADDHGAFLPLHDCVLCSWNGWSIIGERV